MNYSLSLFKYNVPYLQYWKILIFAFSDIQQFLAKGLPIKLDIMLLIVFYLFSMGVLATCTTVQWKNNANVNEQTNWRNGGSCKIIITISPSIFDVALWFATSTSEFQVNNSI